MISLGIAAAICVLDVVTQSLTPSSLPAISRIHARFGADAYLFCIGSHNYCIMTPPPSSFPGGIMSPRFGFLFLNFGAKKAFLWPGWLRWPVYSSRCIFDFLLVFVHSSQ